MSENTKEYIKSAVITFIAGFFMVLATEIDSMTVDSFKDGTIVGLVFAAGRTGIKGVIELFLRWYATRGK